MRSAGTTVSGHALSPRSIRSRWFCVRLEPLNAVALMPRISLRGAEGLNLKSIRLEGRDLGLEIGLLRLVDSETNSAVAAFTKLAKLAVPKMIAGTA